MEDVALAMGAVVVDGAGRGARAAGEPARAELAGEFQTKVHAHRAPSLEEHRRRRHRPTLGRPGADGELQRVSGVVAQRHGGAVRLLQPDVVHHGLVGLDRQHGGIVRHGDASTRGDVTRARALRLARPANARDVSTINPPDPLGRRPSRRQPRARPPRDAAGRGPPKDRCRSRFPWSAPRAPNRRGDLALSPARSVVPSGARADPRMHRPVQDLPPASREARSSTARLPIRFLNLRRAGEIRVSYGHSV